MISDGIPVKSQLMGINPQCSAQIDSRTQILSTGALASFNTLAKRLGMCRE